MQNDWSALELLAPARDATIGMAAIDHGADAVYIGGPGFGARVAAGNSIDDIAQLCAYAHRFGARVFMTLNTLVYNDEFDAAVALSHQAKAAGVDALIVQDMGLASSAELADMEIHASTQCDIRSPEKAALMDAMGFSQVVLARELTLEEIAACRAAMPRARIECFVHGALCVSYSGRCFLSCAQCARSANRGACAQPCRLPYSVFNDAGEEIAHRKHVLSLKDNDQSDNLAELIAAGVSSFKIEGRLKGIEYVKNITAYYRKRLDAFLASDPGRAYRQSSWGRCQYTFAPNPSKTFHRDRTEYFTHGRSPLMAALDTPKSTGEAIGRVVALPRQQPHAFDVATHETLANGDGLIYRTADADVEGLLVNRVESLGPGRTRIHLRELVASYPGLAVGVPVRRNLDRLFTKALTEHSAERQMPVRMHLRAQAATLTLSVTHPQTGLTAQACATLERLEAARNPAQARERIEAQLGKTGGSAFVLEQLELESDAVPFVPAGVLNALRREALERLTQAIENAHPASIRLARMDDFDWAGSAHLVADNCANDHARAFALSLGEQDVHTAFELCRNDIDTTRYALMHCRYCIRHMLALCPKRLKDEPELKEDMRRRNGGHLKATPLLLVNDKGERLLAQFHCKACEMTISRAPEHWPN